MSPTSCRCSTPRRARIREPHISIHKDPLPCRSEGGGRPQRPRLPWSRPHSTLRRCAGSRPGSGWDRVGPARSRPRAPPTLRPPMAAVISVGGSLRGERTIPAATGSGHDPRPRPRAPHPSLPCHRPSRGPFLVARRRGAHPPGMVRAVAAPRDIPAPSGARRPVRPFPVGDAPSPAPLMQCPPSAIRTARLGRLLAFHPPPINPVVCRGPYFSRMGKRSWEGFPLRCFQRFARPNVATQLCRLPDNWPTSGSSSPVLSY